jgi:hypothetical protein
MFTRIRNVITGYGIPQSIVVNLVAGTVCAGAVAIICGVQPIVVVAVVSGVIFLIA